MRLLLILILIGFLVSCSGKNGDGPGLSGTAAGTTVQSAVNRAGETRTVQGVLEFFPTDVKSTQAWLGHEFMVGETPILPTEIVSAETLKGMVGRTVIVEGVWNSGTRWSQPELADEENDWQNPIFAKGETVIRGSGIEVRSVSEVQESSAAMAATDAEDK